MNMLVSGGGKTEPNVETRTLVPKNADETYTPTAGSDAIGTVLIEAENALVPGNIKSGVTIFGVTGTFTG